MCLRKNQGADVSNDSDADTTTGVTATTTLSAGETDLTWDAGMYLPEATIGDFVWNDVNKNGIQDSGEPGIPGVTVQLLDSGNKVVASTTTDSSGKYSFTVQPGDYNVKFTAPAGYVFTAKNQGTDISNDSDADSYNGSNSYNHSVSRRNRPDVGCRNVRTRGYHWRLCLE